MTGCYTWKQMITLRVFPGSVGRRPKTSRASQIKLSLGKCLRNIDSCRLRAVREKKCFVEIEIVCPSIDGSRWRCSVDKFSSVIFKAFSARLSKSFMFFSTTFVRENLLNRSFLKAPLESHKEIKRKGEKAFKTRWKVNFNPFCFSLASQTALLSVLDPASLTPEKYLQI